MRYFIEFGYDGTDYCGWQRQPHCLSVQQILEEGLAKMLRITVPVTGAGRTDAGVHASQMFAHFEFENTLDTNHLVYRLNRWLPESVSIYKVFAVKEDAHARFHATKRSYEYRFTLKPDPFNYKYTYLLYKEPDVSRMEEAAKLLLNYTDFQCFSRVKTDVKTYLCDVQEARFEMIENGFIFHITANRFLRNMVRAIVGTLLEIGNGKHETSYMHEIIASKDRSMAGASAPAKGLFLTKVAYPPEITE